MSLSKNNHTSLYVSAPTVLSKSFRLAMEYILLSTITIIIINFSNKNNYEYILIFEFFFWLGGRYALWERNHDSVQRRVSYWVRSLLRSQLHSISEEDDWGRKTRFYCFYRYCCYTYLRVRVSVWLY